MIMDSVLSLKTGARLLADLRQAASRSLTPEDLMEQKVSFVYGSMSSDNGVTKDHVRQVIRGQVGAQTELAR
ncbi:MULTISPECIES: hypothetical protein [unclassified Acidovorax]|uniref:hypothetical protein n=1 Tax=unclassified Acidovorax TaxID=2684926 RepID=UPI0028834EC7|nr:MULTISPECIES: hypothetical protein [unclassified Acidovorax]